MKIFSSYAQFLSLTVQTSQLIDECDKSNVTQHFTVTTFVCYYDNQRRRIRICKFLFDL